MRRVASEKKPGHREGPSKRPNRTLHGAEARMRDTIEWLLALPQPLREQLEAAESCTFTMQNPAPQIAQEATRSRAPTNIMTLANGSVEAAERLAKQGFRPALLNFAHGYNCGGGFEHASGSQEEDIFRKTSLFLSLWPHRRSDDGPGVRRRGMWIGDYDEELPRKEPYYEHTECGGIYSPHVCVVRDTSRGGQLLDPSSSKDLPTFAVLTVAAQNVMMERPFKPKLLMQKARTILWLAASRGHDSIVLGAFGCGYFNNPADCVAETFDILLRPGGEFANVFHTVVFAVILGNRLPFVKRFPLQTCLPAAPGRDNTNESERNRPRVSHDAVVPDIDDKLAAVQGEEKDEELQQMS